MAADLSGCAALITGAASGIGRASALAFAAAGASVALVDIDVRGLAETGAAARALGAPAEVIQADVTDLAAVSAAVARTVEAFGRLDAAHNNAGVPGPYVPLDEYSEEDFLGVLQVDLVGVWRCMRAEIRHMRTQRAGAIVNTSSMLGAAAMLYHNVWPVPPPPYQYFPCLVLGWLAAGLVITAVVPGFSAKVGTGLKSVAEAEAGAGGAKSAPAHEP
jgi:NAD(P)-dependent dehydrogenase (short-subunit alcohol dehydrogenase family)